MGRTHSMFLATLVALGTTAAAARADECTIRQFGSNRFLSPVYSVSELQDVVSSHEQDVRTALLRAGWQGDPDDFLDAVAKGQVKERMFPVGQEFQWMAFRRAGQPVVFHQKCYGGDGPFMGWEVTVESNGTRSTFAMPKVCGNIAMLQSERVAAVIEEPPEEIAAIQEEEVEIRAPEPPKAICDLRVDEHHLKEEEKLRVAIKVSDESLVDSVHLVIKREHGDKDDDENERWKTIEELTLDHAPFEWEGDLEKDGDYKLVAYSAGDGFRSTICEDRVEVD